MNSKKWKELAIEATSEGGTSDANINVMVAILRSTKQFKLCHLMHSAFVFYFFLRN